jgi:hypothetical protein
MGEMQKVPSAVPFSYRAVRWLPLTILHIAIFMLFFLRRPDSLLNPQLWAEDLLVFFMDDTRLGFWRALVTPYAGYLHVVPRMAAGLIDLLPARFIPLGYNLIALSLQTFSCGALSWACCRRILPPDSLRIAVCLVITCGLASGSELIGVLTNAQWFLSIPALVLLFCLPRHNGLLKTCLCSMAALVIALSAPLLFIVMPFVLYAIWRKRGRGALPAWGLLIGLGVQAALALSSSAASHHSRFNSIMVASVSAGLSRPVLATVLGKRILLVGSDISLIAKLITALIVVSASLPLLYTQLCSRQKPVLLIAVYLGVVSVVLAIAGRDFVHSFTNLPDIRNFPTERYFVLSAAAVVFITALAVDHIFINKSSGVKVFVFFLFFSCGIVENFRVPRLVDLKWPAYADRIDAWRKARKTGASVPRTDVPINPVPWSMALTD